MRVKFKMNRGTKPNALYLLCTWSPIAVLANYRQASLQRQAQRHAHKQAPHFIASFQSAVPKFDQCRYLNKTVGQKVSYTKAMDSYTNINIGHTGLK